MDRTSLHSDAQALGRPIAQKDETGAWTDYIFDGGKCIARGGQFAATPVAAQQVTVRFTNDTCSACLGQPPFQDRNLQVDSITIGGTTIPSSDPSVSFAGGYYVPPGLMATNGDLTFTLASPLTGPVSVQAWGTPDTGVYPHMQVLVNGALVSEYDVTASPQAYTAALTPTDPSVTTTFYLADHLGSAQMEFSSNGTPLSSSQFFPFGGEINPVRTTNHYKFTGKERDSESGLDYFGARYYASSMGRFMSPDWSVKEEPVPYARLDNPQSLNLYGYVGNNPLNTFDPDGHDGFLDYLLGIAKGAYNELGSQANTVNKVGNALGMHAKHVESLSATNADQRSGMEAGQGITKGLAWVDGAGETAGTIAEIDSMGGKLANIMEKGLSDATLSSAERELQGGMGVYKPGNTGELYDHPREVREAMAGAKRLETRAEKMLKNSKLSAESKAKLGSVLDGARKGIEAAEKALKPRGPA